MLAWDGETLAAVGTNANGGAGGCFSDCVFSLASFRGELLAGGDFANGNGRALGNVARWDPQAAAWGPLPGGGMNGRVECMLVAPDGYLYAGGEFTEAGGVPATRVARYDGQRWHALGAGVDGHVRQLVWWRDGVVVVGWFNRSGPTAVAKVAQWIDDGRGWRQMGPGLPALAQCATVVDGDLWVGGDFAGLPTDTQQHRATYVARWNGFNETSWAPAGDGSLLDRPVWSFVHVNHLAA